MVIANTFTIGPSDSNQWIFVAIYIYIYRGGGEGVGFVGSERDWRVCYA